MRIAIFMGVAEQIRAHASHAFPHECCGLLLGTDERIVEAVPSANVAADPATRFAVDPALLLATHRRARQEGLQLLGPYHSHPGGRLEPSPRDVAEAQIGQFWIIASATELTCWRFEETSEFAAIDLAIFA